MLFRSDAQLRLKHKQISDLFQRIGGFARAVIEPVVACPQPYGYRNRLMVHSQWNKAKQALVVGFLRAESRLVVEVEECKIAEPALNAQLVHVRANPPPKGGLKVVLRIAPDGWEVPRDSFFQNNFFLLPKMVEAVRETLKAAGTRFLVDAYCGVGFFSIELASLVERFAGVEIDVQAIKAARKVTGRSGIVALDTVFPVEKSYTPPQTDNPIENYGGKSCGGDLREVFRRSCNIPFARLAVELGGTRFSDGADDFGLNEAPPFDLPSPAASFVNAPGEDFDNNIPILAQRGFGAENVQLTPLQLAMVAATIANKGLEMQPYVVSRTTDRGGNVISSTTPKVWKTVMTQSVADTMVDLMIQVVKIGRAHV